MVFGREEAEVSGTRVTNFNSPWELDDVRTLKSNLLQCLQRNISIPPGN